MNDKMRAIEIAISMVDMRIEHEETMITQIKDYLMSELKRNEPSGQAIEEYGRQLREAQNALRLYKEDLQRLEMIRDYRE